MISNNLGFQSSGADTAEDFGSANAVVPIGDDEIKWRTDITVKRCYPCGDDYPPSIFYCNNNTNVVNNGGGMSSDGRKYEPIDWLTDPPGNMPVYMHHNYNDYLQPFAVEELLRDWSNHDYRPRCSTLFCSGFLIDTGVHIEGINDEYLGAAPDIGAYEYGDDKYFIPGLPYFLVLRTSCYLVHLGISYLLISRTSFLVTWSGFTGYAQ